MSKRTQLIRLVSVAHDAVDIESAGDKLVGDHGAVAAPPDGLRTHYGKTVFLRQLSELIHSVGKLISLHTVGIAAKRIVFPVSTFAVRLLAETQP